MSSFVWIQNQTVFKYFYWQFFFFLSFEWSNQDGTTAEDSVDK